MQYNNGIPEGTRLAQHSEEFGFLIKELDTPAGHEKIRKLKELTKLAEEGEFNVISSVGLGTIFVQNSKHPWPLLPSPGWQRTPTQGPSS